MDKAIKVEPQDLSQANSDELLDNTELAEAELDEVNGGSSNNRKLARMSSIIKKRDELQMSIIRKL